ncbi:hypothetical protein GGI07_005372 [Coemansia sp. Benny D115]|nr:hypothetical protein GGI07_005372 [Coemansia sp. Benny D115]
MKFRFSALSTYAGAAALFASVSLAAPVSVTPNLIIFGNSLSDVGNAAALTHTQAYWEGRYSNSYVWNEYVAKMLGMNLVNKAYGGATSNNDLSPATAGDISIPSLHDQVVTYLQQNPKPSQFNLDNDVIEIEIGGNDILHRAAQLLTGAVDVTSFAQQLAASISSDIKALIDAGYKNINLWNLPAVDKTPALNSLGAGALAKPLVAALNNAIKTAVLAVATSEGATGVHVFDVNGLMEQALKPEVLSALGITDSTDACVSQVGGTTTVCTNPDEYFFYDAVHPASRMHYLWGIAAAALTRNPNFNIDTAEILKIAETFDIKSSNRENNIIVKDITPSESAVIPQPTGYETATPTSDVYVRPTYTTTVYVSPPKCHQ